MPTLEFPKYSYILYINYFGLCGARCKALSQMYPNLIVDNTQAFFDEYVGLASFNSLRKFFRVQNGAYLYCSKTVDDNFDRDNLILEPVFMHENYNLFVENELKLDNESEIKYISGRVEKFMQDVDLESAKSIRRTLYNEYNHVLWEHNLIKLELGDSVPYCYPFRTQDGKFLKKLESGEFILLNLWGNNPKLAQEFDVIAFPLDDENYARGIINYFK